MNRPLHIWVVFAVCAVVLVAVLGWVSVTTLRLDQAQAAAAREAEQEERVRLALWRMDSALTALIVEESARPADAYLPFREAQWALTKGDNRKLAPGEILVPSPLLTAASSNVLLHFQLEMDGVITSPEVPEGRLRELAEGDYVTSERVELYATRLSEIEALLARPTDPEGVASFSGKHPVRNDTLLIDNADVPVNIVQPSPRQILIAANNPVQGKQAPAKQVQEYRNTIERQMRANVYQQAGQQAAFNANPDQQQVELPQAVGAAPPSGSAPAVVFKVFWLDGTLVMARRLPLQGRLVTQACWLNWTNLHASLLGSVGDLLPNASLEPVRRIAGEPGPRELAILPARLIPGPVDFQPSTPVSPVRVSLMIAWACVVVAGLAIALLLHGTLSLSERRGAFVSAVTHELRTPLTTFKMYSEMLAGDMVPEASKRQEYLRTLCSESNRLSHLVENVLAYARLERGSARQRVERVALRELIERVKPRLQQRVSLVGTSLRVDAEEPGLATVVHVDVTAVEQILFNLVDNACKYATPAEGERAIFLEALPPSGKKRFAMLRVRDNGEGLSAEAADKLFQPFSKSAHQAAYSAPGVGLGLALCRRLSRSLGGDLRWDPEVSRGACFELALPLDPA